MQKGIFEKYVPKKIFPLENQYCFASNFFCVLIICLVTILVPTLEIPGHFQRCTRMELAFKKLNLCGGHTHNFKIILNVVLYCLVF